MLLKDFRCLGKKALIRVFIRLLQTEDVRHVRNLNHHDYVNIRGRVPYVQNPFASSQRQTKDKAGAGAVFITGRFRSGSTLLWNIFRNIEGFNAYYEPFNERRWFDQGARATYR
jgi:hypothetical protein